MRRTGRLARKVYTLAVGVPGYEGKVLTHDRRTRLRRRVFRRNRTAKPTYPVNLLSSEAESEA